MSRPMNLREFADVVNHIQKYNSPFTQLPGYPVVKYMDPHFDFRSSTVFSIGFRGFGGERHFHCQNEYRDIPAPLFERVMAYLTGQKQPKQRCAECQNDVEAPCRIEGCPLE